MQQIFSLTLLFAMITGCSKKSSIPVSTGNNTNTSRTYFVATTGSDANAGTVDSPLRGINTALSKANPGDTVIVRTGIYYEKVSFPKSGRLDKHITLKAYTGEKPVIDGTGLSITGKEALVTISNVNYIVFEGFDVCNYKSSTPWVNINGILINNGSGNITVRKNKIYNIEHNVAPADGRSGHGIEIIGNTSVAMKNILVEDNEIHDCNTGYSENLTINGYVDGFIIQRNKIYNAENIGIDAAGGYWANSVPAFNYARNGIISDNEIYNIDMTTGPVGGAHGHGAIGIYIDGARNIVVERNKVHEADRGIGIVSENDAYPTENCIVRNNFVYNCWRTGIYLGGYLNYTTGGTNNCAVVNNTIFYNNREPGAFGEVEGEIRLTENCNNNTIKNNIVYARPENDVFIHKYTSTGSNNIIDHNLYYTTGTVKWIWNGVEYADYAAWKKACGGDANSTNGIDPLLTSTSSPDLHIQAVSPAKNSGAVISTAINGSTDIDGNTRIVNNKISKGAQQ
ncbi:right-handed parallel beta-helix repeat-containing protein [Terrimonas pollutisoli]|uniref:right-handed parallel beta-helix repeat-containing protein n=1 Tax=Terrimonas pollutisoli TaxID=3034147 RepID=UPI0023EC0802|nr:right-handed parallel beta-helix repeat-containing protein [Terrimonas sp. H1YJ31]